MCKECILNWVLTHLTCAAYRMNNNRQQETSYVMIFLCKQIFLFLVFQAFIFAGSAIGDDIEALKEPWPDTDFTRHNVPLTEINFGGIPKDGIPSINRPRFETIKRARHWIDENEPVLVVTSGKYARAYPLQILIYHQIVNDTFKGEPIVVTFCPLCYSGLVMSRVVGNKTLTFGTTGLLRNSGLIMFDRQTESWWQQFTGIGIVGDYVGQKLSIDYSSQLISFGQFALRYPKSKVLSRDTGFRRKYGLNPFQGYDSIDSSPLMFTDPTDPRLPPMERVMSVRLNGAHKIYPYGVLDSKGVINDVIGGTPIIVMSGEGYVSPLDQTDIAKSSAVPITAGYLSRVDTLELTFNSDDDEYIDDQTQSVWNVFGLATSGPLEGSQLQRVDVGSHFAFAALAFAPDAEIYRDTVPKLTK